MAVLISHYCGVFWYKRDVVSAISGMPALDQAIETPLFVDWLNPTGLPLWAGVGVGLFFLVSGFVIPFSFEKYDRTAFLASRFFRLWPTYAVGFLIMIAVISIGNAAVGQPPPYTIKEVLFHSVLGLREIFSIRGFDGIIWTLEIEIKFYLIAALIAPWLRTGSLMTFGVPLVLAFVVIIGGRVLPHPQPMIASSVLLGLQFVVFMFVGVAINFAFCEVQSPRRMLIVAVGLTVVFLSLSGIGAFRDVAYVSTFIIALAIFLTVYRVQWLLPENIVTRFFADISYPIYVVHGISGYVMILLLLQIGWPPFLAILCTTMTAILFAFVIHLLIERPTRRFGQRLGMSLAKRSRAGSGYLVDPAGIRPVEK